MLIVGLGEAGKNIAELFKSHKKTYKILIFDESEGLEPQSNAEGYDEHPVKVTSRGLKSHSEGILFVCGSGKVAGATLRVLEALQAHKMTVVYLVPDLEFASREEKLRNRAHLGILQEYARSGKIDEIILISNKMLLESIGAGPIRQDYEKVNHYIYSIFQNLNYCQNVDQDFGKLHKPKEISRISTIGWSSMHGEEQTLFPLENITESCYYMNIDESDLDSDEDLLPNCQQIVRNNNNLERHSSFAIWRNSEAENHYYVKHYTHHIQEIT
jgi:hypothetical protein